jgi:hypothetical protein
MVVFEKKSLERKTLLHKSSPFSVLNGRPLDGYWGGYPLL